MLDEAVLAQQSAASQVTDTLPPANILFILCIALAVCLVFVYLYSLCDAVISCAVGSVRINDDDTADTAAQRTGRILSMPRKYRYPLRLGEMVFGSVFLLIVLGAFFVPLRNGLSLSVGSQSGAGVLSAVILTAGSLLLLSVVWMIPRRLASEQPEKSLSRLCGIIPVLSALFVPMWAVCRVLSAFFLWLFGHGSKHREKEAKPTEEKIMIMVDEGEENGTIEENTRSMIENVFEFDDTTVGEVMTHRKDVVAVRDDDTMMNLTRRAIESGRSRIPVYHDDIDDIIGMIYVKDLLRFVGRSVEGECIDPSLVHDAVFVPESKRCSEMFEYMTAHKTQIAVVVDEFGGTGGIITMEDLVESILGSIQDEYDNEDDVIKKVNEYSFTVDGTTPLDEIEDLTGISFEDDDNDTIAGVMLDRMGHIPKGGEHPSIMINGTRFTVLEADQRRISKVLIVKHHTTPEKKK